MAGLVTMKRKDLRKEELGDLTSQISHWVADVLHKDYESLCVNGDFLAGLQSGVVLCDLVMFIQAAKDGGRPKTMLRVHRKAKDASYFARDNLAMAIRRCSKLGVPQINLFTTTDVIERKGLRNVLLSCVALAKIGAQYGIPAPPLVEALLRIEQIKKERAKAPAKAVGSLDDEMKELKQELKAMGVQDEEMEKLDPDAAAGPTSDVSASSSSSSSKKPARGHQKALMSVLETEEMEELEEKEEKLGESLDETLHGPAEPEPEEEKKSEGEEKKSEPEPEPEPQKEVEPDEEEIQKEKERLEKELAEKHEENDKNNELNELDSRELTKRPSIHSRLGPKFADSSQKENQWVVDSSKIYLKAPVPKGVFSGKKKKKKAEEHVDVKEVSINEDEPVCHTIKVGTRFTLKVKFRVLSVMQGCSVVLSSREKDETQKFVSKESELVPREKGYCLLTKEREAVLGDGSVMATLLDAQGEVLFVAAFAFKAVK